MDLRTFLYRIPKVELHVHLAGTVSCQTFLDIAHKNKVEVPTLSKEGNVYDFRHWSFPEFLTVYKLIGESLKNQEDFERVTYETLHEAADCNVRYREMSWSPTDHLDIGIPYKIALNGIIEGIKAAEADFGIQCRLIAAINREETQERALELVNLITSPVNEYVIGVGLDYNESGNPPERFWQAYRLAAKRGLHRTAHAGEIGGPPNNVETCLDLLDCERIDHGYRVLESSGITKLCAERGIIFNVVPTTWRYLPTNDQGELVWTSHPIRFMVDQGLRITINSDDPGIMQTNPAGAYIISTSVGFSPVNYKEFMLNSIDAAWIDETTKREWTDKFSKEMDALIDKLDNKDYARSPL